MGSGALAYGRGDGHVVTGAWTQAAKAGASRCPSHQRGELPAFCSPCSPLTLAAGLIVPLAAGLILPLAVSAAHAAPAVPTALVTVHAATGESTRRVPASFIGVSVEYNELPAFERSPAFPRLLRQLASRGSGPLILRVGGQSADDTYWPFLRRPSDPAPYRLSHSLTLSPGWLSGLASLVRAAKVRVMLNLNLAAHSPEMAAQFTAAALRALPAHTVSALELGNEPDLYQVGMVGFTSRPAQTPRSPASAGCSATRPTTTAISSRITLER